MDHIGSQPLRFNPCFVRTRKWRCTSSIVVRNRFEIRINSSPSHLTLNIRFEKNPNIEKESYFDVFNNLTFIFREDCENQWLVVIGAVLIWNLQRFENVHECSGRHWPSHREWKPSNGRKACCMGPNGPTIIIYSVFNLKHSANWT